VFQTVEIQIGFKLIPTQMYQ